LKLARRYRPQWLCSSHTSSPGRGHFANTRRSSSCAGTLFELGGSVWPHIL